MALRVTAVIALLVGAAIAVFSIYAVTGTASMAQDLALAAKVHGIEFDAADWSLHWRATCLISGLAGAAILVGGTLLFAKRRWGFLLISIVVATIAVLPWILESVGAARYEFENANGVETLVLVPFALGAAVAYFIGKRRVDV